MRNWGGGGSEKMTVKESKIEPHRRRREGAGGRQEGTRGGEGTRR